MLGDKAVITVITKSDTSAAGMRPMNKPTMTITVVAVIAVTYIANIRQQSHQESVRKLSDKRSHR